ENMLDIQEGFIRYYTAYALNCVTGSKSIFDVISKDRANLGAEVKATLAPIIGSYGITVDDVYIGEVYPSEDLLAKVNERLNKYNELS
ncbi:SPFH domain-containing protein, partial [Vibrio parahaemolyticus]